MLVVNDVDLWREAEKQHRPKGSQLQQPADTAADDETFQTTHPQHSKIHQKILTILKEKHCIT